MVARANSCDFCLRPGEEYIRLFCTEDADAGDADAGDGG